MAVPRYPIASALRYANEVPRKYEPVSNAHQDKFRIAERYRAGASLVELADEYGYSQGTLRTVLRNVGIALKPGPRKRAALSLAAVRARLLARTA